MQAIHKSTKLDNICYDIRGPVTDLADQLIAQGVDILKLNTGNPAPFGFNVPDEMVEKLFENVRRAQGYCDSKGLLDARIAIADYCTKKGIPDVTPNDIYTGNGVSELISMVTQALLNDGDEVLVPSPDYPLWTGAVTLAGGTAVHYLCDERSDWNPDVADIRKKITSRTKAIVIINPNNPTGALYPKELLLEITALAREHDLIIFSDEIYDRLVLDGLEHVSTAALAPDLFTVTMNGLSKSHLAAGFRCGWMCVSGEKRCAKGYIDGLNMLASMRLCANVLAQTMIPIALEHYDSADPLLQPGGRIYEQREYITNAVSQIPGLSVVRPKAAFYLFPKLDIKRFGILDDERFAVDFLREKHVLITHGRGFHWQEPDHFRIVFLPCLDDLKVLGERLSAFLETYHQ